MTIQHLIIFCGAQILGLILILLRKKFRNIPNFMLILILVNIISHYIYYYFFYEGIIGLNSNFLFIVVPFAALAPVIVYYYISSVIYGTIRFYKTSVLHLVPFFILSVLFIFFMKSTNNKEFLLFVSKSLVVLLYIIYPWIILNKLCSFYGLKKTTIKVFKYNKGKISLIKLLLYMMVIHFVLLVFKIVLPLFIVGAEDVMNIINLVYLMILGYALSYVIISEPTNIQLVDKRLGLGGFRKYKKSKLTKKSAVENLMVLNSIMATSKPYLNLDFNLAEFSKISGLASYVISETLNGLTGQSFHDYINNYRVEEFKKRCLQKENKNFTILAIAFESGFKSKATFNSSFKKITGTTPSQFIKANS